MLPAGAGDVPCRNTAAEEVFGRGGLPEAQRHIPICILAKAVTLRLFGASTAQIPGLLRGFRPSDGQESGTNLGGSGFPETFE
jgi:hypothetical protein